MNREYFILGTIIDDECERWSEDDLTLTGFMDMTKDIQKDDEVVFNINSAGGSVTSGIAIANKIKQLSKQGVKTTARIEGICASIATCIMCACDNIIIDDSAFVMIHNCWSVVQGDANKLRKEADIMEKMNEAILSFYRSKFDLTDEQLKQYMDDETWFSGAEAKNFKLHCDVVEGSEDVKIAASLNKYHFKNIPRGLIMEKEEEKKVEETKVEETEQKKEPVEETKEEQKEVPVEEEKKEEQEEPKAEETTEPTVEELKKENEDLKKQVEELKKELEGIKTIEKPAPEEEEEQPKVDTVTKEECDKRVSGMQASMQKQVNDFKDRYQKNEKELIEAKASITRLNEQLEAKAKELSEMASAYAAQKQSLEILNSNVNTPNDALPTFADGLKACKTPAEKVAFIKSGKYVR